MKRAYTGTATNQSFDRKNGLDIYAKAYGTIRQAYVHIRILLVAILLVTMVDPSAMGQDYKKLREKMVRTQIQADGITHQPTLKAMRTVPRHLFVPEEYLERAYNDGPLPIGYGQTISQPYIVAFMTQIINPKATDKVLEIGTGSGYQAAVLSAIVRQVFTIEIVPELGELAKTRLKEMGYSNVYVRVADGFYGWKEHGPFDAIVVTAAAEFIPPPLVAQLKDGGKMIIPIGSPFLVQNLILVKKKGSKLITQSVLPVKFVPFTRSAK
jgi:protein-L-isoaspartate(D-aspartate) O-methyltransferase